MVIVDSSVWIDFFRVPGSPAGVEVDRLMGENRIVMVGPVMMELLQGARSESEFDWLQSRLCALPFHQASRDTLVYAGWVSYQLRRQGVPVQLADILIAAIAIEGEHELYTTDHHFQRIPHLSLYEPRP